MQLNETGNYIVTEGEKFIVDPETNEKILFYLDKKTRLVIRSFLMEDIKPFVQRFDLSSSEKRKKQKMLYDAIPKKGSELYFFAIERIVGKEQTDRWNEIYELERVPIAVGERTEAKSVAEKQGRMEAYIFTGEEEQSDNVLQLIAEIGKLFEIEGKKYINPC